MCRPDKQFRSEARNMKQFYVRSDGGAMVPLDNLISITQTTTPQVISHYNLFRSAGDRRLGGTGYSSGQAIAAWMIWPRKCHKASLQLDRAVAGGVAAGGTSLILFGLGR